MLGAGLTVAAPAFGQNPSGYYGGGSNAGSGYGGYGSPSLLPLPSTSSSYYGGGQPASAYAATEAPYQSAGGAAEPIPAPALDGYSSGAPNNQPSPSDRTSGGSISPYSSGSSGDAILGGSACNGAAGCGAGGCNLFSGCGCWCGGPWFGTIGGLGLTRNEPNRFWTTYETNNNPNQLMNTQFAGPAWGGGGEVNVGRWFGPNSSLGGAPMGGGSLAGLGAGAGGGFLGGLGGGFFGGGVGAGGYGGGGGGGCGGCGDSCGCCPWGIMATYWGVSPLTSSAGLTSPTNTLSTPIDLGYTSITNSVFTNTGAGTFFDNSHQQSLSRVDRINNVELNFITQSFLCTPRTQAFWLAGVRYFRFDETLTYGAAAYGHTFTDNNGAYACYLRDRSVNNLVGPQIGVQLTHWVCPRFGLFITPKFGIYGNFASTQNTLYTGDGYTQWNIKASQNQFSTLGQLDVGGNFLIKPWCSIYAGYRLVAVDQVALADNQFLPFLADTVGFGQPKTNGSLLLHGAFGGLVFRF
jgi:hypothetical protein